MAFAANSDLCLSLLRRCVDYGEKVIGCHFPYIPLPTPIRMMASYDLRERTVRFQLEMTGISAGNAAGVQGQSSYSRHLLMVIGRSLLTRVGRLAKV